MTTSDMKDDQTWGMLADLEEAAEERRTKMLMMTTTEYALPDDKLGTFTLSRLSTCLSMDTEAAQQIAASYDTVINKKCPVHRLCVKCPCFKRWPVSFPKRNNYS
jgi:hypothetical protein